ncbi:ATP-binding protein [Rhodocaloribacter litoris]|uniref:ATP-binding protein n=1 Tax=Rhodocaloribacter litoris TaxID=2558931 RepID=UPI00141FE3D3|nr:ATP-binding protein [Rhodocaloribacter litoris]QXD15261.1 ATP-binding protein [Rhodocaloribacter litoris]GIV62260.1 MAG: ATP-binding protein [Rhodothermaceae bacterium]
MDIVHHRFRDLNTIIDHVHGLFDRWNAENRFPPAFPENARYLLRQVVHEWIANLVQHADFHDREPEIHIDIQPNGRNVHCVIEDNSDGFDLNTNLRIREAMLEKLPERGMGLLMMERCTEDLVYYRAHNGHFRLEFSVSADKDPWMDIPF